MQVLSELRKDVERRPESSAAAVKLAKHLLALGNVKSNSGFPPSRLSKEQYETILKNGPSPKDRKILAEHYRRMTPDGFTKHLVVNGRVSV
jgi:hypothetical protein